MPAALVIFDCDGGDSDRIALRIRAERTRPDLAVVLTGAAGPWSS